MSRELFNDIFEVLEKDPDGKQFDKGGSLLMVQLTHACTCVQIFVRACQQNTTGYSNSLSNSFEWPFKFRK